MRHHFRWAALLLVFTLPALAADKGNKKDATIPTEEDYDALLKARDVVGKILSVESSGKGFTFQYDYQSLLPDQKKINAATRSVQRQQQQLLKRQQKAMRTRNPAQRAQKLAQIALQLQNLQLKLANNTNLYKTIKGRKDFDLQAIDDVKVRVMELPIDYDDKGRVKEYTAKEKRELKGKDSSLPGYTASWENVSVGQTVRVYFKPRKKKTSKDKDADKEKKKDKEKDKDDELVDDSKPQVKMIVILKEPTEDDEKGGKRKKKG